MLFRSSGHSRSRRSHINKKYFPTVWNYYAVRFPIGSETGVVVTIWSMTSGVELRLGISTFFDTRFDWLSFVDLVRQK